MALDKYPHSLEAQQACKVITAELQAAEERVRRRKRKDQINFETAVTLIVSDLMDATTLTDGWWLYRSVRREAFQDSRVKADIFLQVIRGLCGLGYAQEALGGNHRNEFAEPDSPNQWHAGDATRFRATPAMIEKVASLGVALVDILHHFKISPRLDQIRLKSSSSRLKQHKINGRNMKVPIEERTDVLKAELKSLNRYLLQQEFTGFDFYGLRRIFNEGDREDFDWNMGGRLYAISEHHYQRLKKAQRLKIKINGEAVVEIDINASYLRILHGIRKFPLPAGRDIYAIKGLSRVIVKAWITATLGHTGFHRAWPSKAIEAIEKAGIVRPKSMTAQSVQEKVLERFPVLHDWPTCGIRWSHLMHEESEAVIKTMSTLSSLGIPALPVHDSIIVPKSAAELATNALVETLEGKFGVAFKVSVSRPRRR